jgi:beta-lactamase class D
MMLRQLICILIIFTASTSFAEDKDLAELFKKYDVKGTVVISSLSGEEQYIHNDNRAKEMLSPASTFKIPNSLIALEEKIILDENEIISWDNVQREMDAWNRDQTLMSAFKSSTVWVYQRFAQKIGKDNYLKYLSIMDYGNKKPSPDIQSFWLHAGDLRISPVAQVEFLKKVYSEQFPFSKKNYAILKKIMLEEDNDEYKLYSKTGSATKDWIGHGWYVGYIETKNKTYFFATNLIINGKDQLPLRKEITLASLRSKNIIK